jgi:hypothetical protein
MKTRIIKLAQKLAFAVALALMFDTIMFCVVCIIYIFMMNETMCSDVNKIMDIYNCGVQKAVYIKKNAKKYVVPLYIYGIMNFPHLSFYVYLNNYGSIAICISYIVQMYITFYIVKFICDILGEIFEKEIVNML